MKRCTKCGEAKPATREFFHSDAQSRDGLHARCKPCKCAYQRERKSENAAASLAHYHRNSERLLAAKRPYKREWYERNRERVLARCADYRATHADQHRESARAWRERNAERYNAARQRYRDEHREQHREWMRQGQQRRRERKRNAPGVATAQQIADRLAFYGWRCWMCGAPWSEIDHVIPLARGGTGWPANLRPACRRCNARKNAHPHLSVASSSR